MTPGGAALLHLVNDFTNAFSGLASPHFGRNACEQGGGDMGRLDIVLPEDGDL